jgi:hypothetical protein
MPQNNVPIINQMKVNFLDEFLFLFVFIMIDRFLHQHYLMYGLIIQREFSRTCLKGTMGVVKPVYSGEFSVKSSTDHLQ